MSDRSMRPDDPHTLRRTISDLEAEVDVLRRRLQDAPTKGRRSRGRLGETTQRLQRALEQNEKLSSVLEEAREQLSVLRSEVEKLTSPPNNFGTVLGVNADGSVDIMTGNRKLRVAAQPTIEVKELMQRAGGPAQRELHDRRLPRLRRPRRGRSGTRQAPRRSSGRAWRAPTTSWLSPWPTRWRTFRSGSAITSGSTAGARWLSRRWLDPRSKNWCSKRYPTSPTRTSAVSGTRSKRSAMRSSCRTSTRTSSRDYGLVPPKGILLYGPPGCGKTLIAKAVANSLAKAVAERTGRPDARSYFLNIKGPELLNKWVGETERQIRLIFQRAKEKSDEGVPVIVFFDEMDSLFRTRGTGISSDVESTIVPQLLSELDGVESLKNVIVIGASNREDLIDPAILRPGRLDVKIKISTARSGCRPADLPDLPRGRPSVRCRTSSNGMVEIASTCSST